MLLLLAALAANGGKILEARLEAEVSDGPDVAVRLTYRIEANESESISFSALEIDGVAIDEVAALASETRLPVSLQPRSGPKREGSILLPEGLRRSADRFRDPSAPAPRLDPLGPALRALRRVDRRNDEPTGSEDRFVAIVARAVKPPVS